MTCICVWELKRLLTKGLIEDDSRLLDLKLLKTLNPCSEEQCHKYSLEEKVVIMKILYPKMAKQNTTKKVLPKP